MEALKKAIEGCLEDQDEANANHPLSKLLTEALSDNDFSEKLLNFALEIIGRLACSEKKERSVNVAKMIVAGLPTTKRFFNQQKLWNSNNREYWLKQVQLLNFQYVGVARLLVLLLEQYGEVSLSRELLMKIDPTALTVKYMPEIDSIRASSTWRTQGQKVPENKPESQEEKSS